MKNHNTGYVVKIDEDFPGPIKYLNDTLNPNESPYHQRTPHLIFAKMYSDKDAAEIIEDRARSWFEENFEDEDSFSTSVQKVDINEVN